MPGRCIADQYWLAARTDPDAPKHKGITLSLVDIEEAKANGMSVTTMHCIDGDRTGEVFFDNVHLDNRFVVGELTHLVCAPCAPDSWPSRTLQLPNIVKQLYYVPSELGIKPESAAICSR